jgi:hypothetical protein
LASKSNAVLPKRTIGTAKKISKIHLSPIAIETAALDAAKVYARLDTRAEGLTAEEAKARLEHIAT